MSTQATRLAVLGATGSVGRAALEVATRAALPVVGLVAGSDAAALAQLCHEHQPQVAALADAKAATDLASLLVDTPIKVTSGNKGINAIATGEANTVVAAISGMAGMASTLAAARAGKRILLANKESLVVAGHQLLDACTASGGALIPVDSEHGALLELLHLARERRDHVAKVWLTASGGPFRESADLREVTPAMAYAHPVWNMGPKISVDSATLMNKGLEVIEACLLFDLAPEQVEVVVHPQGVVHAIIEFIDGGCIAQCGPPDMRAAVARALAWPAPQVLNFGSLDWRTLGELGFYPPDERRFPCLRLAREALIAGGNAPAVLNAANEVAVAAFVNGNGRGLRFTDIPTVIECTLAEVVAGSGNNEEELYAVDAAARVSALAHTRRLA